MATNILAGRTDGPACSNIAEAGKQRRRIFGYISIVVGVGLLAAFMAFHTPWYFRLALFLPAAGAATGILQARRNVCLAHAAKGTIEANDFSATKAPDDQLVEHRKVAATIRRDSLFAGIGAAVLGAVSAFIL